MVANGLNFTLTTYAGDVDLLGEVAGLGSFDDMALHAMDIELFGAKILMLSLEQLIRAKSAAGRAKDLLDLEALRRLKR